MRRFRLKLYTLPGPAFRGRPPLWGVFRNDGKWKGPIVVSACPGRALDLLAKKVRRERKRRRHAAAIDYSARPDMTLQAVGLRAIERARRNPPGFDH